MDGAGGGRRAPQLVGDGLQSVIVALLCGLPQRHQQIGTVAGERGEDRRENG